MMMMMMMMMMILLYSSSLLHLQTVDYLSNNASGFCQLPLISLKTLPDAYDLCCLIDCY